MYVIIVYCPTAFADLVIDALVSGGAGEVGNYRNGAFTSIGEGRFEPKQGATPFVGEVGRLEKISETKIEMICLSKHVRTALSAMLEAHPYEEPAYHVYEIKTVDDFL